MADAKEVEERIKKAEIDARARNISHNVRCTECGSQSIEDSQADIAILLRKVFTFFSFQTILFLFINLV
jgi:cytochrome c-type biogenesis protein CcmH